MNAQLEENTLMLDVVYLFSVAQSVLVILKEMHKRVPFLRSGVFQLKHKTVD